MAKVTIGGEVREYEVGTPLLDIAREYQHLFPYDIILVFVDGKLSELHKKITGDCRLRFVTTAEKPGMQAYQRSATLIMLKAFYEVVGAENIDKVSVDFSVGKGFFVDPRGRFQLTEDLLQNVKEKMQEYVEQKIPIMKRNVNTDEAIELFTRYRMYDKARLFRYRRVSRVNISAILTWFPMNTDSCSCCPHWRLRQRFRNLCPAESCLRCLPNRPDGGRRWRFRISAR